MATQILGTNHAVLLPRRTKARQDANPDANSHASCETPEEIGGPIRGLFFAMLFNVMLALTGVAGWVIWRLIR
jgi:hypothetical protein